MNQSEEFDDIVLDISLPPRIVLLKVQLATIEASIPSDALESFWSDEYRKSWGRKLHMSLTAKELLQCLTLLEDSIKREFLSVNYETSSEILSSSKVVGCSSRPGVVPIPPWMPLTAPAVALRLMDLDASIYYTYEHEETCEKNGEDGYFNNFSSLYSAFGCSVDNPSQAGSSRLDNCWVDLRNGRSVLKRGRGRPKGPSRTRGGKFQGRAANALYADGFSGAGSRNFTESVDYGKGDEHGEDVDYDDDEYNDEEDDDGVDEREDYFAEGYVNSDYQEEEGNPIAGRERVQNAAGSSDGDSPSSSEYSY
ncbi:homeobox-DDT domain protein RLT2-like isoform X1 [Salvia miltiorrhiza]|uniref:homeobox-DDT domain protein RLT2-like isoform X1 n=2 Tax=Salvia miltiorrhiza TaxID=226208 RepID=UPI0025ACF131|nr:homeobox-DDT domain protein RLT2-like isoform X1 [Salvia miltiorrhiza]XP_057792550.1 homeobox-DDT domain protein RLT2-like isoform X1 [Salvia miltiorrhiza]